MHRDELTEYLNRYLKIDEFNDDCPNGLQVQGKSTVKKIITSVSASVELFNTAVEKKADAVIVHHGIIWYFERPVYKGGYRERIKILLENDINLYAYHLPLDAHEEVGNNARICQLLGVQNLKPLGDYKGQSVGLHGTLKKTDKNTLFSKIAQIVNREPLIFEYGPDMIESVGVISGGAQKELKEAVMQGLDIFITGEVSEHIMHYAKEENIHFVSAGHYATEKFGILALGQKLQEKYNLSVSFEDIPNPV
jgi:dinuclear metal center YbgI/SA1388 family protein